MLPSPDQNVKIGSVGRSIFFFFFFTYRERVEFSNIFLKVSKWGKLGRNAVKTHIYKCFFKPLNTNLSKFLAQIWHFQTKKTKTKKTTLFFRILRSVGRGQHKKIFFGPKMEVLILVEFLGTTKIWYCQLKLQHCLCLKLDYVRSSLVTNTWANQMSIKITLVPDHVFVPSWWACSLISSFKDVTVTLRPRRALVPYNLH